MYIIIQHCLFVHIFSLCPGDSYQLMTGYPVLTVTNFQIYCHKMIRWQSLYPHSLYSVTSYTSSWMKKHMARVFISSHMSYFNRKALPTLTSALVLSVTSMTNSVDLPSDGFKRRFKMFKSTVAPRLSMLEMKQYSRPCNVTLNNDLESLSQELTKMPTKFHCSTNQQHPALSLTVWPLTPWHRN
jgi:hypothetical protein